MFEKAMRVAFLKKGDFISDSIPLIILLADTYVSAFIFHFNYAFGYMTIIKLVIRSKYDLNIPSKM